MDTKCNHTEEIAQEFYNKFATYLYVNDGASSHKKEWLELTAKERDAWGYLASKAIPVIANHAMNDLSDAVKGKAKSASGWKKAVLWFAGAGLAAGTYFFTSCSVVDSLILQGEKGQVRYYVTDTGERVLVVNPAKVTTEKK